jgi:hypothetical protein
MKQNSTGEPFRVESNNESFKAVLVAVTKPLADGSPYRLA